MYFWYSYISPHTAINAVKTLTRDATFLDTISREFLDHIFCGFSIPQDGYEMHYFNYMVYHVNHSRFPYFHLLVECRPNVYELHTSLSNSLLHHHAHSPCTHTQKPANMPAHTQAATSTSSTLLFPLSRPPAPLCQPVMSPTERQWRCWHSVPWDGTAVMVEREGRRGGEGRSVEERREEERKREG